MEIDNERPCGVLAAYLFTMNSTLDATEEGRSKESRVAGTRTGEEERRRFFQVFFGFADERGAGRTCTRVPMGMEVKAERCPDFQYPEVLMALLEVATVGTGEKEEEVAKKARRRIEKRHICGKGGVRCSVLAGAQDDMDMYSYGDLKG